MSTKSDVVKKSLKDFGYAFNDLGQLRQLDSITGELTDKSFDFEVSKSHSENQKNYENLGETITDHVYELLDNHGLHRIYLPADQPEDKATFIFSSQKELKDVDKLMVLIHGLKQFNRLTFNDSQQLKHLQVPASLELVNGHEVS